MIQRRNVLKGLGLCAVAASCGPVIGADKYPAKPVQVIAPFVAGGGTDILARVLATKLSAALGQSFIVDNKAGATGSIGADYVAKATPDGYTLLLGSNAPNAINQLLYPKLPYEPTSDFEPVSLIALVPNVLLVGPSVQTKSVPELIELARSKPGKLTFASAGVGSPAHLAGELFKSMAHVDMTHVPYKGGAAAVTDVIAGRVDIFFGDQLLAINQVRAGKLRPLAVTTVRRSVALPELPTIAEAALPGYDTGLWYGLFAPKSTPPEVLAVLNTAVRRVLGTPDVRESIGKQGGEAMASSPEELKAVVLGEIEKWKTLTTKLGIKLNP